MQNEFTFEPFVWGIQVDAYACTAEQSQHLSNRCPVNHTTGQTISIFAPYVDLRFSSLFNDYICITFNFHLILRFYSSQS